GAPGSTVVVDGVVINAIKGVRLATRFLAAVVVAGGVLGIAILCQYLSFVPEHSRFATLFLGETRAQELHRIGLLALALFGLVVALGFTHAVGDGLIELLRKRGFAWRAVRVDAADGLSRLNHGLRDFGDKLAQTGKLDVAIECYELVEDIERRG